MKLKRAAVMELFTKKGDSFIFLGEYLEIRIPKNDFTSGAAVQQSNSIDIVAVFPDCRVWKSKDRDGKYDTFKFISTGSIETFPSLTRKEGDDVVMCYHKNDVFIDSAIHVVDWRSTSVMNKALFAGKLDGISNSKVSDLVVESFRMNDVDTGLPPSYIKGYVALSSRSPNDLNKQLRHTSDFDPDTTDFKFIPLKKFPAFSSDASSLMFEGIHTSLATRVANTGKNKAAPIDTHMLRTAPELDENHEYY